MAYPTPQPPDPIFPGGFVNAVAEIILITVAPPCSMNRVANAVLTPVEEKWLPSNNCFT